MVPYCLVIQIRSFLLASFFSSPVFILTNSFIQRMNLLFCVKLWIWCERKRSDRAKGGSGKCDPWYLTTTQFFRFPSAIFSPSVLICILLILLCEGLLLGLSSSLTVSLCTPLCTLMSTTPFPVSPQVPCHLLFQSCVTAFLFCNLLEFYFMHCFQTHSLTKPLKLVQLFLIYLKSPT